jgi:hypothetical protein
LPGWVWNLERRKQWQAALGQWRAIENIVILVELPPASEPESVLLAQNLPNLIWLSDRGVVHAGPTREQLQTLRDARCNLVGSVVNHNREAALKSRLARWSACFAIGFCFLAGGSLQAADAGASGGTGAGSEAAPVRKNPASLVDQALSPKGAPPLSGPASPVSELAETLDTNLTLSGSSPAKRGNWQRRFTLGPGDVLNFALYGQPELNRADVPIGPDGRVTYLQAQDVVATGLTVDELRAKMDEELSKFYRTPHSMITPRVTTLPST